MNQKYDTLLSTFAFNFNLRRCTVAILKPLLLDKALLEAAPVNATVGTSPGLGFRV